MKYYQLLNIFGLTHLFIILFLFLLNLNNAFATICTESSRTCTEGPADKIISGTLIHKDCWNYAINYQCYDEGNFTDNCDGIKQIPGCSQLSSSCQSHLADGACSTYLNHHVCGAVISNPSSLNLTLVTQDQHIITEILDDSSCDNYAQNADCTLSRDSICVDGAQTRIINGLAIARDCWSYQKQYTCRGGFVDQCAQYEDDCQLQNHNCLSSDNTGHCTYNTNTYLCQSPATETTISCGSQDYITYPKNQDFGKAAANLALLQGAAKELKKDTMTTFSGSGSKCSKALISFNDCCKQSGWGTDLSLASCSPEEKNLAVSRSNSMCVYVGSYCSNKERITGLCLSMKETYCCFGSKLSRIVNEQGRPQIGMNFGSAESPNCSGILITDLQKIDFSKVDFRELFNDFLTKTALPDAQATGSRVSSTVQDYYKQPQTMGQSQRQNQGQGHNQSQNH